MLDHSQQQRYGVTIRTLTMQENCLGYSLTAAVGPSLPCRAMRFVPIADRT